MKVSRIVVVLLALVCGVTGLAQTTISTGSIQGTVTDPSGAIVPGAKVTITSQETGQVIHLTTTTAGLYASGALTPGHYTVTKREQQKKIGRYGPFDVDVTAGQMTKVEWRCDTGMR